MKIKKISFSIFLLFLFPLFSCSFRAESQTIAKITANTNVVYVLENDHYVPFLIADSDYKGNVLLLRKNLLPQSRAMNSYIAYYPESEIDLFLTEEYLPQLSNVNIVPIEIEVTSEEALGLCGTEILTIQRQVFLLSLSEIGITSSTAAQEGSVIDLFRNEDHYVALNNNNAPASWSLRTPNTYYRSCFYGVGPDGKIGSGNAFDKNGIRPAFCVSPTQKLEQRSDILPGEAVYVLISS